MSALAIALRRATRAGCQVRLYADPSGRLRVLLCRRKYRSPIGRYEARASYFLPDEFTDEQLARAVEVTRQQLEVAATCEVAS